ncbi:hypothetical protein ACEYYB_03285 [Paracoccus sp. p4-l81]
MLTFLKILVALVVLGLIGVAGYAYLGDMQADPVETRLPVTLNGTN